MKLIITNAAEVLNWSTLDLLKRTNFAIPTDQSEYAIDLPIEIYPHPPFSIKDNTLYAGLQWIGTISERINPTHSTREATVHLNAVFADVHLGRYVTGLYINPMRHLPIASSTSGKSTPVVANQVQATHSTTTLPPAVTIDDAPMPTTFTFKNHPTEMFFSHGSSDKPRVQKKRKKKANPSILKKNSA